jgi:hypothetical protein
MSGLSASCVSKLKVDACDFTENGGAVAPGAGQHNNLLVLASERFTIRELRSVASLAGSGI